MLVALRIEATYTKDKILELYLNRSISARQLRHSSPSLNYYGKSVHELTLAEAAYLAALPRRRTTITPSASARRRSPGATM